MKALRWTTALLLLIAHWPTLRWFGLRLNDGADEPLGLIALALALIFALRPATEDLPSRRILTAHIILLLAYAAAYAWLPPIVRALVLILQLALTLAPRAYAFAWLLLLTLSLPLISSLQFYLGYPLRLITTHLSAALLNLFGLHVQASGTTLLWANERVIVDAPCSGIQMAWSGLLLAATLACWQRLPTRQTLQLIQRTLSLVFLANVVRATALFCMGTKLWSLPASFHEGIGLALFSLTAWAIVSLGIRQQPAPCTVSACLFCSASSPPRVRSTHSAARIMLRAASRWPLTGRPRRSPSHWPN